MCFLVLQSLQTFTLPCHTTDRNAFWSLFHRNMCVSCWARIQSFVLSLSHGLWHLALSCNPPSSVCSVSGLTHTHTHTHTRTTLAHAQGHMSNYINASRGIKGSLELSISSPSLDFSLLLLFYPSLFHLPPPPLPQLLLHHGDTLTALLQTHQQLIHSLK